MGPIVAERLNEILRIPFKDRTFGVGGEEEGVYWAFIDLMKQQEKSSAESGPRRLYDKG